MRGQRSAATTRQRLADAQVAIHQRERAERMMSPPAEASPEMLRNIPKLTPAQRRLYRQTVKAAPWLQPADIRSLVLWVKATDAIDRAEDLKSVKGEAAVAANLARQLGLTPAGRVQLGISDAPPVEKTADPWKMVA